jgi:FlaA1/EpsC-like NDP-sugar epimerase
MAQSFCCELTKSLRVLDYDTNSEYISPYYIWFKEKISNAINNHLLDIDLYQLYPQLHAILKNVYEFSLKLKSEDLAFEEKRKKLLNAVHGKTIILFGIGSYGLSAVRYLHEHNISVVAACDNNNTLWHTRKYGLPVYSPLECIQIFPDGIYLIAIKKSNIEIYKQLINMGINQTNIFIYP